MVFGVSSGVVVMMEYFVLDFISVLHPVRGLLISTFVVVLYRFGVIDFIFVYLYHLLFAVSFVYR